MKIIDLWVATYFSLIKKNEQIGIIKTLSLLRFFWSFNMFSILSWLSPLITKDRNFKFVPIFIIISVFAYLLTNALGNQLEKRYLYNWDFIKQLGENIPKLLAITILVLHYLITIAAFIISLRCYRFLIR